MKKVSKKEIKNSVANVMHQTLFELQIAPTRKLKKLITDASKKFSAEIKSELKKQVKKEKKTLKKVSVKSEKKKPGVRSQKPE